MKRWICRSYHGPNRFKFLLAMLVSRNLFWNLRCKLFAVVNYYILPFTWFISSQTNTDKLRNWRYVLTCLLCIKFVPVNLKIHWFFLKITSIYEQCTPFANLHFEIKNLRTSWCKMYFKINFVLFLHSLRR